MNAPERVPSETAGVSIGRQPVFDRQRRLWGYDLFCVGDTADSPSGLPADRDVPVSLAASAEVGLQQIVAREKHVMISLTEKGILDELAYALPSGRTIVLVNEGVYGRPGVPERLQQLKDDGFQLAVRGFSGAQQCQSLYGMADILDVTVEERSTKELTPTVTAARTHRKTLMASHVPDLVSFASCQGLGFDLYEGAFSKAPEIVPMRRVSSSQVARFNVLKVLDGGDQDVKALAKAIQTDATISYRLLTHLNSASFGFSHKIASIPHAISLLGWRQVASWLRVVLLSDVNQGAENNELLLVSAQRAKFLELTAERYAFWGFKPESMHLLGLFSLLDAMIGVPMKEVVTHLPLDAKLKGALCKEPKNEYQPLLSLVQHLEEARWDDAETIIQQLNLDSVVVRAIFQEAIGWAAELASVIETA